MVFVLLDAIPASELEQLETPNLDQIAKIGVERNAVNIWKSFKKIKKEASSNTTIGPAS
ncbi:hypothetical protein [Algoriphagus boritolerans]|uniref:hypothetical protein n=1 Tax=Algoriphagus boritolerans TaxID=308111 RepID=UPI002FCE51C6